MITASIVLFHSQKVDITVIIDCIEKSCIDTVYIIDNSSDDRFRLFEKKSGKIWYIYNKNLGYGASHNIALHEAIDSGSEFHIVLNPDIRFTAEVISELASYMREHEDTAYILPKVLYPDGTTQYLCKLLPTPSDLIFRRFIPNIKIARKMNERYVLQSSGYDKIINPPCLSGCFMFLRISTIKENNLFFDERYFMYCEDFDFIRRLHKVAKTIFYPYVSIVHDHQKGSYKSKKMLIQHIKSAVKFFNKWGWIFDSERNRMNRKIINEIELLNKK
ncbi:MAG: glycosyltransferase family 2 protein [Treponema sp.]|jgi:GT2 family glycosyltransferase|nr:glycosyltransferase family 2 protein [Treponema sp.]